MAIINKERIEAKAKEIQKAKEDAELAKTKRVHEAWLSLIVHKSRLNDIMDTLEVCDKKEIKVNTFISGNDIRINTESRCIYIFHSPASQNLKGDEIKFYPAEDRLEVTVRGSFLCDYKEHSYKNVKSFEDYILHDGYSTGVKPIDDVEYMAEHVKPFIEEIVNRIMNI